jgi:pimeloyl-ACP methyl ester carboxylesterase
VAGERGAPIRRDVARELAGLLTGATLHTAEAGHLVPLEAPETIVEAIAGVAAQ